MQTLYSSRKWPSIVRHASYISPTYPNNKLQYSRHTNIRQADQQGVGMIDGTAQK